MFSQKVVTACVSGVLALTLVACGSQEKAEEPKAEKKTEKTEQVEKKDERKVLGTESADAYEIALTNGLDGKITSLKVRVSGEEAYGDSLVPASTSIDKSEEVRLFVAKSDKEDATHDILVTLEGVEGEIEFLEVPLSKAASASLAQSDGVSYVEYVDAAGTKASTKDAALKRKQDAEAAAEAEAQASQQTYQQETYSEPEYTQTYSEPEPVTYEQPVQEAAPAPEPVQSAPEQTDDACMGDVVLRY